MYNISWTKKRPTKKGFYLCWRKEYHSKPEFVEIRDKKDYNSQKKELVYIGNISSFPLEELEDSALFSEECFVF